MGGPYQISGTEALYSWVSKQTDSAAVEAMSPKHRENKPVPSPLVLLGRGEGTNRKGEHMPNTQDGQMIISPEIAAALADRHYPAAEASRVVPGPDVAVRVNPGGYIGESTKSEIDHAVWAEKPIDYLVPPSEHRTGSLSS